MSHMYFLYIYNTLKAVQNNSIIHLRDSASFSAEVLEYSSLLYCYTRSIRRFMPHDIPCIRGKSRYHIADKSRRSIADLRVFREKLNFDIWRNNSSRAYEVRYIGARVRG